MRPCRRRYQPGCQSSAFSAQDHAPNGDTLVVIFLRGAADALNIIVPHGEQIYYDHRPTLAIPRPDDKRSQADLRALDLDGFFRPAPAFASLAPRLAG